jgi:hypothetical protein
MQAIRDRVKTMIKTEHVSTRHHNSPQLPQMVNDVQNMISSPNLKTECGEELSSEVDFEITKHESQSKNHRACFTKFLCMPFDAVKETINDWKRYSEMMKGVSKNKKVKHQYHAKLKGLR